MILWMVVKHTQNNNNKNIFIVFVFEFFRFLHFDFQLLLLYANFTVEQFLPISCQFHIAPFVVVIVVVANLSLISICVYFVVVLFMWEENGNERYVICLSIYA